MSDDFEDPAKHPTLFQESLSLILDFTPVVGTGKSVVELVTGKDHITGEHVSRWLAAGGIILGLIPFGKLLTKGRKSAKMAETIASKIAYDAPSKAELLKKMEKVIPTETKEIDHGFILQEIKKRVKPEELKTKFGVHHDPLDSKSDMNLVHQSLVQLSYGGHAVHKHWISGGKKSLLQHVSEVERKKITSALDDSDEVFEYLKVVLKDPKTLKASLPNGNRVGFANVEKKVIIIHNPEHAGTFYHHTDPIQELNKIFNQDLAKQALKK